ncbi:MAG: metallophosphoesterase family protein [Planctomycetota bacterium]|jgi:putative phosphoesterase
MRIGIVSDSHGHTDRLRRALALLAEAGAQEIVHCGDIGSTECVEALSQCGLPSHLVAGNMDRYVRHLSRTADRCGLDFDPQTVEVTIGDSQHLVATHGHHGHLLDELIAGGQFPYVCHGHTHRFRDERIGPVRVINPGALHHPKGPHHPTVAVLDTDTDDLQVVDVAI